MLTRCGGLGAISLCVKFQTSMKTGFYNRTLLSELKIEIPKYFIQLDDFYDSLCPNMKIAYQEYGLKYPENIARRYADIKYYDTLIRNEYNNNSNPFIASLRISSLLVGFYNSVKSYLDAIAITLNHILDLRLSPIETDLCRKQIWKFLPIEIKNEYESLSQFFDEVRNYRNAASHRLTPNVMVCGPTSARQGKSPQEINRNDVELKLIDDPENNIDVIFAFEEIKWVSPLLHINKWNSDLEQIGELIIKNFKDFLQKKLTHN